MKDYTWARPSRLLFAQRVGLEAVRAAPHLVCPAASLFPLLNYLLKLVQNGPICRREVRHRVKGQAIVAVLVVQLVRMPELKYEEKLNLSFSRKYLAAPPPSM